jgi:two-component system sensor histidine kinase BaeS
LVVVIGGGATALAYRRISRPVGDLLGAADRVSRGDYDVRVPPDGPASLRALTTTFNEMASRLAVSEEQRRRFLAEVTHELRTPLAVLQSGLEAQVDGIHPRDERHLGSLVEETQVLGRLIDDLHTLALADAGRLTLHYEPVSPRALVEDAIASQAALAGRRRITLTAEVVGDVPEVEADPTRLRQVLTNLLSNAVRHSPEGGSVRVGVEATSGDVRFSVTDTGPGIPSERLTHLFERAAPSAGSRGSGLGLSIAHDLVRAHGGAIQAANEPGGGATVSFEIPVGRQP